jgi:PAS domain S-box-containing protein
MTLEELQRITDVPVVLADHTGCITYVNPRFVSVFGWAEAEVVRKPLSVLIPMTMRDAHNLGFSRFLTTGRPTLLNQPLELNALAKNGQEIGAEVTIVAEEQAGHWTFGATLRPLVAAVTSEKW